MSAAVTGTGAVHITADAAAHLPWEDLHGVEGVRTRVLSATPDSLVGILEMKPSAGLPEHVHEHGHHHVFVLSGTCMSDGIPLTRGAYVHIPAGTRHALRGGGPEGCVVLYCFLGNPLRLS